tara:strand:+ start:932 stop:1255 length:324 start_codon:yes stop_codon:yes gene_type:complete
MMQPSNVPKNTIGFSHAETEFANRVAIQAYNMNCSEVHIDSPSRVGDSVLVIGPQGSNPINVHFHGKKHVQRYQVANSTVTFVMNGRPMIQNSNSNSFTSYGLKYKC